jgi:release factor glutamine methyltransferase
MNKEEMFLKLRNDLEKRFHALQDKPEENADSTLKALWHLAAGSPLSSEKALLMPLPELSALQVENLNQFIELRLSGVPLAHITGRQNFLGIELLTDKRALIPRKETELLGNKVVELSLAMSKNKNRLTVIDVGCGSGNLGLAMAVHNPHCIVFASDISQDAVNLTRENIDFLKMNDRVTVKQGDLLAAFDTESYHGKTDLVVCNPPYISSAKVAKMDTEISANEPTLAFDGGMLGTSVIQRLIREAHKFLSENGCLAFEVGLGQGSFIIQLCERTQLYSTIEPLRDASENIRAIVAWK